MELRLTSTHPDLKKFFESQRDNSPDLSHCGQMMLDLVKYLEEQVEASPQWAYTDGRGELLLYSEVANAVRVRVNAYPKDMTQIPAYEIKYALEPPWTWATGYATTLEDAVQMVLYALQHSYEKGQPRRRFKQRPKRHPHS
jgi:hypothetical protein